MNEYVVESDGLGTWKSTRSKDDTVLASGLSEDAAIEDHYPRRLRAGCALYPRDCVTQASKTSVSLLEASVPTILKVE